MTKTDISLTGSMDTSRLSKGLIIIPDFLEVIESGISPRYKKEGQADQRTAVKPALCNIFSDDSVSSVPNK